MLSFVMWRSVDVVRADVSAERITTIIMMKRFIELGTTTAETIITANVVPSSLILFTLIMEAKCSSESSLLTRTTCRQSQKQAFPILTFLRVWPESMD
jgi:hypothetical protein